MITIKCIITLQKYNYTLKSLLSKFFLVLFEIHELSLSTDAALVISDDKIIGIFILRQKLLFTVQAAPF